MLFLFSAQCGILSNMCGVLFSFASYLELSYSYICIKSRHDGNIYLPIYLPSLFSGLVHTESSFVLKNVKKTRAKKRLKLCHTLKNKIVQWNGKSDFNSKRHKT